jgi:hypothetical protein
MNFYSVSQFLTSIYDSINLHGHLSEIGEIRYSCAFLVFESPLLYFTTFFIPDRLKKQKKKLAIKSLTQLAKNQLASQRN